MDWGTFLKELALSPQAIVLYASIVLFAYRLLRDRFQWNTERWEGLVLTAFNAAEAAGFKTGQDKLDHALTIFAKEFEDTYNKPPSIMDLKDAALDLARFAYEHKLSGAAVKTIDVQPASVAVVGDAPAAT
ncbi:MAG: hypothetical protein KIS92_00895 [Planctomycetota bacterium]|nr:hypothetical protein [Planctomycetota bacterium]